MSEVTFAAFTNLVQVMIKQDSGYYVVTRETGLLASFFGVSSFYYIVDKNGSVTNELGKNPELVQYPLMYKEGKNPYYVVYQAAVGGVLRDQVAGIYWLSSDQSQNIKVETSSGWNIDDTGILSVSKKEDGDGYYIYRVKAENGEKEILTDVEEPKAIFTMAHQKNGWYFFDYKDGVLALYKCSENFENKEVVKIFHDEIIGQIDLEQCSVEFLENTLFFYIVPDDLQTKVLYRYSVGQ